MQLGIRLHDTKKLPFEERIADVHELGFACGHLALSKVIDEFPTDDSALTPGLAMYIKKVFAQNDVDIAVLGCYLNLANPSPEKLQKITKRYLAHLRFASLLGCGVVGTETGAPNETYTAVPECHGEEALQTFIKNLRPVVQYAEKTGVILAIEPVWKHIVYNPARARRVLEEIASPNLQVILDPVNLLDISNYAQQKEIVEEAIDVLGEDIAMVHIKDFRPENGKLVSVGAGLGEMDYTAVMKFIREKKPFMHVTLENTTPEDNIQCKNHILKLYQEAG
ncbi:MAG: sugar phosphate isomerase/epimerase [Lachnospiraceae bacterium]|nr:sugar phosphate isomerase/epimerase [Lachnospiraceae bacterium]